MHNFTLEQINQLNRGTFIKMTAPNGDAYSSKQVVATNAQELLNNLAYAIIEAHTLLAEKQKRGDAPRDCLIKRNDDGTFSVAAMSLTDGGEPLDHPLQYVSQFKSDTDTIRFPWKENGISTFLILEWGTIGDPNWEQLEAASPDIDFNI